MTCRAKWLIGYLEYSWLINIGVDMHPVLRELFWVISLTEHFPLLGMIALGWNCVQESNYSNLFIIAGSIREGQFILSLNLDYQQGHVIVRCSPGLELIRRREDMVAQCTSGESPPHQSGSCQNLSMC
jgi:hypothetical protein